MIVDFHNHIGVRHGAAQLGHQLVEKLDKCGVDRAVVFAFVEGAFSNRPAEEAAKAFPSRIIPFCAVNPWDREDAVREFERCVRELGFRGLKLHPTLHGYHLADHGLLDPIFEYAASAKVPIISHGASDLFNSPLEFAEIARRHPGVPLVMAHMGMFWSTDQAVEVASSIPNLYLEASRAPVFEIATAVRRLGPEKVLWGTDSPFVDYEGEFRKMERVADSREAYDLVMGGNAVRLLNM
jgi:predicted TIM-barrel fold metal-dependent hydrolase